MESLSTQYARFAHIGDEEDEAVPGPASIPAFDPSNPPKLTLATGEHALKLARESGDKQTTAHLCRLLCSKYLEEGDVGKGRELLASAVSLYKEMGDSKMQEQCDVLYGQVAQFDGQLDVAISHFSAAAKRMRAHGQTEAEATQRIHIGRCYEEQAQVEQARVQYQCALELAKQLDPPNLELVGVARELSDNLGSSVPQQPPQPQRSSTSFLQRAKDAGWDDDESDSDEDITGAHAHHLGHDVQGDLQALEAAMSDAATLVTKLRLQGREKQAAELESLMRAEIDSDDSASDSDEVDCEQLD